MEVYFFGLNGIVIKSHGGSTLEKVAKAELRKMVG